MCVWHLKIHRSSFPDFQYPASLFRKKSADTIRMFSWDAVVADLQKYAPTLVHVLRDCVEVKRRNSSSRKLRRPSSSAVISVCGAILLRNYSAKMNLVQRMVSILLSAGHASKMVCVHVQCTYICTYIYMHIHVCILVLSDIHSSAEDAFVLIA